MKYKLFATTEYKKAYSKLTDKQRKAVDEVVDMLICNLPLPPKYKDHKLKGNFLGYRDCHVCNDLLLLYKKNKKTFVLTAVSIGSHSELF